MTQIHTFLIPPDNYTYIISTGASAIAIDTSQASSVVEFITGSGLKLNYILSTHFHSDHTVGNRELKERYHCEVLGLDRRIDSIDRTLAPDEQVEIAGVPILVMAVSGHTKKAAAYYLPQSSAVFTGDTLFGAGCGRLFEGAADGMYGSLMKLALLPGDTKVYCGHEYTRENLEFALTIEPGNPDLLERLAEVKRVLAQGGSSMPSTIELEQKTNPFLRASLAQVKKKLQMAGLSDCAVFAELRRRKDRF
jgi:hydroxyacylglutathione hydrolase